MNNPLASGHEKGHKTPATAMSEADLISLSHAPLIVEIEGLVRAGKSWAPGFSDRVDAVSIALFGIVAADTQLPHVDLDQFYKGRRLDEKAVLAACDERDSRMLDLWVPPADATPYAELISWWLDAGVDVCGEDGVPLRCLTFFEYQLNAAVYELLPNARLTLDGSGRRGAQSTDAWGAALAEEAARFRLGKR